MVEPHLILLAVLAGELTQDQADAFIDSVLLGRSLSQIAADYGITGSAVGFRLQKARAAIADSDLMAAAA